MASTSSTWISKFQTAQHENQSEIKNILKGLLKGEIAKSHPQMKAKESHNLMNQQLKKYHAHISKCSKRLEGFRNDEGVRLGFPLHEGPNVRAHDPYLKFCFDHLCHLGKRKTADTLTEQGSSCMSPVQSSYIEDIYDVIQALQHGGDLSVAEDWVLDKLKTKRITESISDQLTYCITKIKFLILLQTTPSSNKEFLEALEISQVLFSVFYIKNICVSELNEMMCCLLFSNASPLTNSETPQSQSQSAPPPWLLVYPHLTVERAAQEACEAFRAAAAEVHGLPPPPLSALRTLLQRGIGAASVLNNSSNTNATFANKATQKSWEDLEHVSFSGPISSCDSYHSVFTCPVSRELSTKENLPMLLQCGHVVLSSSMRSLPSSGRSGGRFKCPTCYHEMARQDSCMALHL